MLRDNENSPFFSSFFSSFSCDPENRREYSSFQFMKLLSMIPKPDKDSERKL